MKRRALALVMALVLCECSGERVPSPGVGDAAPVSERRAPENPIPLHAIDTKAAVTGNLGPLNGELVQGFRIVARGNGIEKRVEADANGSFAFVRLPAGEYALNAESIGPHWDLRTPVLNIRVEEQRTTAVVLRVGPVLRTRILLSEPWRQQAPRIRITPVSEQITTFIDRETHGSMALAGLEPGRYIATIRAQGVEYSADLDLGLDTTLDLDLRDSLRLDGEVVDSETGDYVNATLLLRQKEGGPVRLQPWKWNGNKIIYWGLLPGRYELSVSAEQYEGERFSFTLPAEADLTKQVRLRRQPATYTCAEEGRVLPEAAAADQDVIREAVQWYIVHDERRRLMAPKIPGFNPRLHFLIANTTAAYDDSAFRLAKNDDEWRPEELVRLMKRDVYRHLVTASGVKRIHLGEENNYREVCSELVKTDLSTENNQVFDTNEFSLQHRFPRAVGILVASLPGYSRDGTEALVHVGDVEQHALVHLVRNGSRFVADWRMFLPLGYC